MKKLVQINSVINSGSTGRIAEDIGSIAINEGWESIIAFGRNESHSQSKKIKIGNNLDIAWHGLETRVFDRHGLASKRATHQLIKQLNEIKPDIIHLHNVHGYYLNIKILFTYLANLNKPVVWTLHDCWAFTGHCSHYMSVGCNKWKTHCFACPQKKAYPKSLICDRSKRNFDDKKNIFNLLNKENTLLVTPSKWLASELPYSYLRNYKVRVINNGININRFRPSETTEVKEKFNLKNQFVVLGVASVWDERKGLSDFIKLRNELGNEYRIVIVGLNDAQLKELPAGITGIKRTESIEELASLYSLADIFFNPTYEDNFPTTNLEALACGTPVLTYRTGGSPESVSSATGIVIEQGDLQSAVNIFNQMYQKVLEFKQEECQARALSLYNQKERFEEYITIYNNLIKKQ